MTPNQQIRHRDPAGAAMPDLVARPGTVVRVEGDWVVVRWRGAAGESRVLVKDVVKTTDSNDHETESKH